MNIRLAIITPLVSLLNLLSDLPFSTKAVQFQLIQFGNPLTNYGGFSYQSAPKSIAARARPATHCEKDIKLIHIQ